ncbi:MAG: glycosyltransferase family 4 protein [Sedimentisphaerales bacterium]|nr:glycosyltransferase family 4 protein [Sedimentisphaerales bacterium]
MNQSEQENNSSELNQNGPSNDNDARETAPAPAAPEPAALRVVLLADDDALRCYGPVLRRMAVGLIDEVADLSLLCLGKSSLLEYVPSPPIRLIWETRRIHDRGRRIDSTSREINIIAPRIKLLETLLPRKQAIRLADVLSPYKPTLIHALSERQMKLARNLSRLLNIPYIVSILSLRDGILSFDRHCGRILPCNSHLAREVRQKWPALSSRIQLIPIGTHVPDEVCCFSQPDLKPLIFCCGRLMHGRGFAELINAMKRIALKNIKFNLLLSGEGPAEHDFRRQIHKLELGSQVHIVPPVETVLSVSDVYKTIFYHVDIFVQPWPEVTWRPELLEAMSVGNAVVVAAGVENDLIVHEKSALVVPFHDEQKLTETLEKLLTDQPYARSIAEKSQTYLRKHFLASHMVARLAKAYRQAVQK